MALYISSKAPNQEERDPAKHLYSPADPSRINIKLINNL